jgi:hypothetical protein
MPCANSRGPCGRRWRDLGLLRPSILFQLCMWDPERIRTALGAIVPCALRGVNTRARGGRMLQFREHTTVNHSCPEKFRRLQSRPKTPLIQQTRTRPDARKSSNSCRNGPKQTITREWASLRESLHRSQPGRLRPDENPLLREVFSIQAHFVLCRR